MNNFKQKLIYVGVVFLSTLTVLEATAAGNNPFRDLGDNQLAGFFLGGGVGYGITRTEDGSAHSSSARTQWKVGYAISEQLGFYVTSAFTDIVPEFGVMWFPEQEFGPSKPLYYLQALIGFYSYEAREDINTLSLAGGIGYEFRRHFMCEATAGYNQVISQWGAIESNKITFVASVNYLFY